MLLTYVRESITGNARKDNFECDSVYTCCQTWYNFVKFEESAGEAVQDEKWENFAVFCVL